MTTDVEDVIEITFYTDPLCCWCFGMLKQLQSLIQKDKSIRIRYCTVGLIPDWKHYFDDINSISRPAQMAPLWVQAGHQLNLELHALIWVTDPPQSSYPACIAIKCAQLQSREAAEKLYWFLSEALMIRGKNIAKNTVLLEEAELLSSSFPSILNYIEFKNSLFQNEAIELFRSDLNEIKQFGFHRFPSLLLSGKDQKLLLTGYQPEAKIVEAIERLRAKISSL